MHRVAPTPAGFVIVNAYNVTVSAAPYTTRAAAQIEAWRLDRPRRVAGVERAASPVTVSMSW